MQQENEEKKIKKVAEAEKLAVLQANLRAWNYWGRTWRFGRKKRPLTPYALRLMKTRALTYRKVYLKIITSAKGLKGKIILDVGCGTSEYLRWLSDDGDSLVGIDISVEMLKLCREDIGKSIKLIAADALHLPLKDGVFDIGMTFQSLHHFPDWKRALSELVRTSRWVILYEPNADSVLHKIMHWVRKTFHVEQRFRQTDEDYELVEYHASGFSSARIMDFLVRKDIFTEVFMFGTFPVSLLEKVFRLSTHLAFLLLAFDDFLGKMPIIRKQLGGFLVIGRKNELCGKPCDH
ncbi:MAG: class I SAM-dependent methyltransferase [Promethearchaeota archaeon]